MYIIAVAIIKKMFLKTSTFEILYLFIHMNLDHIIATTSFMSRDLDNLQATKLLFSAGGRKQ